VDDVLLVGPHSDPITDIITKDTLGINGQSIFAFLDTADSETPITFEVRPVLIRIRLYAIVLEVDAVRGQNGYGL
jgi:hypothetical protein